MKTTRRIELPIYKIDPLEDPRWAEFLERHPRASVFHTPGWLEALCRTYGYEPVAYTTSPPGAELANGIAFCRIQSWLTGHRLVSLPFSDHCEPLVDSPEDLSELLGFLQSDLRKQTWKYIEIRPLSLPVRTELGFENSQTFCFHKLDLRPTAEELFRSLHKDCVQRKIRRAEREALSFEEGRSEELLSKFYHLLLLTRRRQQLPPHPRAWFHNLTDCLSDTVKIRVASKDGLPVASIVTLSYKDVLVYKYGCSDARFHNLGATPFLFWKAIQEAKDQGLQEFDLGRSDNENSGLIAFKGHWGAARFPLTYLRYSTRPSRTASGSWGVQVAKQVFARMPSSLLTATGKLLYKHIG